MNDTPESLARQNAERKASLAQLLPDAVRRLVEQELATLRQQHAALIILSGAQMGDVKMGDVVGGDVIKDTQGRVDVSGTQRGAAVGINQGTIQFFFTAAGLPDPADAQRALVQRYLAPQHLRGSVIPRR